MDYNELRDKAFTNAIKHGWHRDSHYDLHWKMMIVTELAEAIDAERCGRYAEFEKYIKGMEVDQSIGYTSRLMYRDQLQFYFNKCIKDTFEDELADVFIRLLDYAGLNKIDLSPTSKLLKTTKPNWNEQTETTVVCGMISKEILNNDNDKIMVIITLIELILFAKMRKIDLMKFVDAKMEYNEFRSYKHGGKRY